MEISQLEPQIKDTQDELIMHQQKTQKFKEYVQGLFIDVYPQDEFTRRVDAIFNETFKRDEIWQMKKISWSSNSAVLTIILKNSKKNSNRISDNMGLIWLILVGYIVYIEFFK